MTSHQGIGVFLLVMSPDLLTHLHYVRRLGLLLDGCTMTVKFDNGVRRIKDVRRFFKLYKLTHKSIEKDIEFAREDNAFALIAAPWFPVKCYYALYYLESIFVYMVDGSDDGFAKGGHSGIRRKMVSLVRKGQIVFSEGNINTTWALTAVQAFPSIVIGQNTRRDFWLRSECTNSLLKKLMEYKMHDFCKGRNLRTKKCQAEKRDFITRSSLMLIDFFYWYRIKANYRDLDYIDFENGVSESEVFEYMICFHTAFECYRTLLTGGIARGGRGV